MAPTNSAGEVNRVYVCNCFGVTEAQVKKHAADGACTPRQIASACKAGTDCGSCVRRIQALLGRSACPRGEQADQGMPVLTGVAEVSEIAEAAELDEALREAA
ncbi:(2Fe-2S)-binding protein [Streptomyces sporangiiformans]|uniref:Bacterioferritin-associated ferredoxin n=1 Tax=Streptomyces sporangiiformans TaxID=2315329 RepID=A0A505D971_9ACTN|nr:(2Fe-2S)-binding protein [Streptomyces sporangiiformans]TPQ19387.1 (2Fe-2S)-binding protein [Streptomyces sporangiiformans]